MNRPRTRNPLATLIPQERRILALIAEGGSDLGIAQELDCRISTAKKNMTAATMKLEWRRRVWLGSLKSTI